MIRCGLALLAVASLVACASTSSAADPPRPTAHASSTGPASSTSLTSSTGLASSTSPATSPTVATTTAPVTLADGVLPPSTAPPTTIEHEANGTLAPCRGTYNGTENATFAPTLLRYDGAGQLQWALCPAAPASYAVIGDAGDAVLARWFDGAHHLAAYDAATGAMRWWKPIADATKVSIDDDGVVMVETRVGPFDVAHTVLDPVTGGEQPAAGFGPGVDDVRVVGGVTLIVERPTGPGLNSTLRAMDTASGQDLWSRADLGETAAGSDVGGGITVDGDTVIMSTRSPSDTVGLDLATGQERWRAAGNPVPPSGASGATLARGGVIFVQDLSWAVDARATADGGVLWHHPMAPVDLGQRQTQGAPLDIVLMPGDAFDRFDVRDVRTGQVLWPGQGTALALGPSQVLIYGAHPPMLDAHTGAPIRDLPIPCLGDPSCALTSSYIERVSIHGTDVTVAINDFGSP